MLKKLVSLLLCVLLATSVSVEMLSASAEVCAIIEDDGVEISRDDSAGEDGDIGGLEDSIKASDITEDNSEVTSEENDSGEVLADESSEQYNNVAGETIKSIDANHMRASDIAIDGINFPDANFRNIVLENFDIDNNGVLSVAERNNVYDISVSYCNVKSVQGVGFFSNLTNFSCSGNELNSLDVSKNPKLSSLDCSWNKLTNLDVSKNLELSALFCSGNKLTNLDVSKNLILNRLECSDNQLTSIKMATNLGSLREFNCSRNELRSIPNLKTAKRLTIYYVVDGGTSHSSFAYNYLTESELRSKLPEHLIRDIEWISEEIRWQKIVTTNTDETITKKKVTKLLKGILKGAKTTIIPGLKRTSVSGIASENMCPQGITIAGDYMLISAYDTANKVKVKKGENKPKAQNSVIYLLTKAGEYITTIDLGFKGHVGGLAYDSKTKNVWVCCDRNSTDRKIGRFSYDKLKKFAKSKQPYESLKLEKEYKVAHKSFITYYDDKIWVGSFEEGKKGKLVSYKFDKAKDKLKKVGKTITIPKKSQGIAFLSKTKLIVSTSYGRKEKNNSNLILCKISKNEAKESKKWKVPPMSEDIAISDKQLYIVFESAANLYRNGLDGNGKCKSPIDRVVLIPSEKIK